MAQNLSIELKQMVIRNNTDSRNGQYPGGGGALLWNMEDILIENSRFAQNHSGYAGGGLYIKEATGTVRIERCLFDQNTAEDEGGGIYYFNGSGDLSVVETRFSANQAPQGGGLWTAVVGRKAEFRRLEFNANEASTASAWYFRKAGGDPVSVSIENLLAANNTGGTGSQGVLDWQSWGGVTDLSARQLTIAQNTTPAAIKLGHSGTSDGDRFTTAFSNTLIAGGSYGFVGWENGQPLSITHSNTVFSDNAITQEYAESGNPVFSSQNVIVADPKLDDLSRLQSGSGAMDAGMSTDVAQDIDGDARPAGAAYDAGADEYRTGVEAQYRFSRFSFPVTEGNTAEITVERIGADLGSSSVQYATSNGSAGNADYTAVSGRLQFAAGEQKKTIQVATTDDALFEATENITIKLSNPGSGSRLADPSHALILIEDNDANPAGSLAFQSNNWVVSEGAGKVMVQVIRKGGSTGAVTVEYATEDAGQSHDAAAGADYQAVSGTLSFADGELSKTFEVNIIDDSTAEQDEVIGLKLSNPAGGADLDEQNTATITIEDDDGTSVQVGFEAATAAVSEQDGVINVSVKLSEAWNSTVTVDYASVEESARSPADFAAVSGTLSFAAGETTKTFPVVISNDGQAENLERFRLELSNPSGNAALDVSSMVVSIYDQACAQGTNEWIVRAPYSYSGSFFCQAGQLVKAGDLDGKGGTVQVGSGSWVGYSAPVVQLKPGFHVLPGGGFKAGQGIQP